MIAAARRSTVIPKIREQLRKAEVKVEVEMVGSWD